MYCSVDSEDRCRETFFFLLYFQTYVDFMLATALPPPFNIIPTYIGLQPVIEYIRILFAPKKDKLPRWDMNHCCYIVSTLLVTDNVQILLSQDAQRGLRVKHNRCMKETVQFKH